MAREFHLIRRYAPVADEIRKDPEVALGIIDPATLSLPLGGTSGDSSDVEELQAILLPGPVSVVSVRDLFDKYGCCLDERIDMRTCSVSTNLVEDRPVGRGAGRCSVNCAT